MKRTRWYRDAERELGHAALCLIGPAKPVRSQRDGNALIWPLMLSATTQEPRKAPARIAAAHWEGRDEPFVVLHDYVWLRSDAHAERLKASLYGNLLGADPDMRQLNGHWVDLIEWWDGGDWRLHWSHALEESVADLRAGGETVEWFSEEMRFQAIRRFAEAKRRGWAG